MARDGWGQWSSLFLRARIFGFPAWDSGDADKPARKRGLISDMHFGSGIKVVSLNLEEY